jgi:hypothetical protein
MVVNLLIPVATPGFSAFTPALPGKKFNWKCRIPDGGEEALAAWLLAPRLGDLMTVPLSIGRDGLENPTLA